MLLYLLVHLYHVLFMSNMYYLDTISVEKVLLCQNECFGPKSECFYFLAKRICGYDAN